MSSAIGADIWIGGDCGDLRRRASVHDVCERRHPRALDHLVVAAATLDEGVRLVRGDAGHRARRPAAAPADGHAQPAVLASPAALPAGVLRDHRDRSRAPAPRAHRAGSASTSRRCSAGWRRGPRLIHWVARCAGRAQPSPRLARPSAATRARWSPPSAARPAACCAGRSRCAPTASACSRRRAADADPVGRRPPGRRAAAESASHDALGARAAASAAPGFSARDSPGLRIRRPGLRR